MLQPVAGSISEEQCCGQRCGATMDATGGERKRCYGQRHFCCKRWSAAFLLQATVARQTSEVRRARVLTVEDERGAGLFPLSFPSLLFRVAKWTKESHRTVKKSVIVRWPGDRPKFGSAHRRLVLPALGYGIFRDTRLCIRGTPPDQEGVHGERGRPHQRPLRQASPPCALLPPL